MQQQDEIGIEILKDGTIKVTTSRVSAPNHMNADKFLAEMQRLAGGTTVKQRNKDAHHHHHHGHSHGENQNA